MNKFINQLIQILAFVEDLKDPHHRKEHVHLFTLNRVFLQGHSKLAARALDDLLLSFIVKTSCLWAYYMLQYPKIMLA